MLLPCGSCGDELRPFRVSERGPILRLQCDVCLAGFAIPPRRLSQMRVLLEAPLSPAEAILRAIALLQDTSGPDETFARTLSSPGPFAAMLGPSWEGFNAILDTDSWEFLLRPGAVPQEPTLVPPPARQVPRRPGDPPVVLSGSGRLVIGPFRLAAHSAYELSYEGRWPDHLAAWSHVFFGDDRRASERLFAPEGERLIVAVMAGARIFIELMSSRQEPWEVVLSCATPGRDGP